MLALSAADVRELVPMQEAIKLVKTVFAELSAGRTVAPLRTPIDLPKHDGVTLFMPAAVPSAHGLGIKIVSVFPHNQELGKPTIHALVVMVSDETGEPLAVLDGSFLTALRTGAASGAATDLLARPNAKILTCIGAGVQAVTQALAVATVRPLSRIYVYDARPEAAESFAERLAALAPQFAALVEPTRQLAQALRESDVVCTATTAKQPVFDDHDIQPGTHLNAIGAFTPEMQEIPEDTVRRAQLIVDNVDAVLAEAGDLIIPIQAGRLNRSAVSVELGEVVAGSRPGRTSPEQVTLFKTVGNAVQDVIVARRAIERAQETGRGTEISL